MTQSSSEIQLDEYLSLEIAYDTISDTISFLWLNRKTGIRHAISIGFKTNKILQNWLLLTGRYNHKLALELSNEDEDQSTDELINEVIHYRLAHEEIMPYGDKVAFLEYVKSI